MLRAIKDLVEGLLEQAPPGEDGAVREHALQLATTALMLEIARADASVSEREERAIRGAVQQRFALSGEETARLFAQADQRADEAVSLYEFTRVLNDHLSRAERPHVIELLWEVANADGRIDKYEEYYVRKIADLLYVSHSDFIRTKLAVTGRQGPGPATPR